MEALREALARHSQKYEVQTVGDPQPMQRVICLVNAGYWYAPTYCQVKSVSAKTAIVYLYTHGQETQRVSRENIFTEADHVWCNTDPTLPHVGIYDTWSDSGEDAYIASVHHERKAHTKRYSEKPTPAQVLADYASQPETFKTEE